MFNNKAEAKLGDLDLKAQGLDDDGLPHIGKKME
jgi:hypothetical protein